MSQAIQFGMKTSNHICLESLQLLRLIGNFFPITNKILLLIIFYLIFM